jgi:hypothetical protein
LDRILHLQKPPLLPAPSVACPDPASAAQIPLNPVMIFRRENTTFYSNYRGIFRNYRFRIRKTGESEPCTGPDWRYSKFGDRRAVLRRRIGDYILLLDHPPLRPPARGRGRLR